MDSQAESRDVRAFALARALTGVSVEGMRRRRRPLGVRGGDARVSRGWALRAPTAHLALRRT